MLEKKFVPQDVETSLYQIWEEKGAFSAHPESSKTPFTIMIPPPNVTGTLHMGHALTMTLQDTLVRWKRMQGYDVLWQPGTDHAGIATQLVVERELREQGTSKADLGREKFVEQVWEWKKRSGGEITQQLRRLGASLDWPRERFTMDEGLSQAVRKVFVSLYNEGLIYRDKRLVNWDPVFRSALSDLEVENKETKGSLWYIRYPLADDPTRYIVVATTRPETLLGDSAVAVHPDDPRYKNLIGKHIILPLVGRLLPIVGDLHSDPEKGSGAVKITPAHDFNDFEVGRRHQLEMYTILDESARIDLQEIKAFAQQREGIAEHDFLNSLQGKSREEARKLIVAELERLELLEKIEPHVNQIPHAERGGAIIEPRLTTQWYCDAATLAKPAIEAVEQQKTVFVPTQWENTFFAWMRDIQPWCISRQLWWGHQIPAWYGPDGEVFVAHNEEEALEKAKIHYGKPEPLTRDEDVLDTWFSSGLWPFTTLGWPDKTPELDKYYPGSVLVTGFDIIFFWVARMMMLGQHFMRDVPFHKVYIHGLVRDERGQKMSKSKGNGIDPLVLIDTYGADATRFTICMLTGLGRDVKLSEKRVEEYRSFVTKLWNAARFCEMNDVKPVKGFTPAQAQLPLSRWILQETNTAILEITAALDAMRFDEYANACYRFVWNRFCDWFLEFAKPIFLEQETDEAREVKAVSAYVLGIILKVLHPVMPFVTEVLWDHFGYGSRGSLIQETWPQAANVSEASEAMAEIGWIVQLISEIRAVRAEMNVPPAQLVPVFAKDMSEQHLSIAARWKEALGLMARMADIDVLKGDMSLGSAQIILEEATLVLPLEGIIDIAVERARLEKELNKTEIEAQKVEKKLENADFVQRAKPEIVEENRQRLRAMRNENIRLKAALARLG